MAFDTLQHSAIAVLHATLVHVQNSSATLQRIRQHAYRRVSKHSSDIKIASHVRGLNSLIDLPVLSASYRASSNNKLGARPDCFVRAHARQHHELAMPHRQFTGSTALSLKSLKKSPAPGNMRQRSRIRPRLHGVLDELKKGSLLTVRTNGSCIC